MAFFSSGPLPHTVCDLLSPKPRGPQRRDRGLLRVIYVSSLSLIISSLLVFYVFTFSSVSSIYFKQELRMCPE